MDLLLADGARGVLRRFAPTGPGLRWAVDLVHRPETVVHHLRDLSGELGQIAIGRSAGAAGERDRRFRDDAWRTNPLLRRILQAYLAAGGTVRALLADAHLDWRDRARLEFAVDNLVAALAPSNNPLISPTAGKALIDSGGAERVQGPAQPGRRPGHRPPRTDDGPRPTRSRSASTSPSPRARWCCAPRRSS